MSWTHTRSRIAVAMRADPTADVTELRRQLKAERLAEYVAKVVAEAPSLNKDQLDRIGALLRGGAHDAA